MQDKDWGVVEGVMGLFDGYDGKSEAGSTAEMAKRLGLPVVLIVDASAMARSVAALVHGFHSFDPDLQIAGVIFNRIGGPGHLLYLQEAMCGLPEIAVLGGLPCSDVATIPERHLGLVTAEEHGLTPERIKQLASFAEDNLDFDQILQIAEVSSSKYQVPGSENFDLKLETLNLKTHREVRFGVARDEAFCFYYPDNLELLQAAGAELIFFSPLHDSQLPPNLQGLYFGGGYPEVHAAKLAANTTLRQDVKAFIEQGRLVYAECGGFMYLTSGIRDVQGNLFSMVGVYPTVARMLPRLAALGYVEVSIEKKDSLLPLGSIRGHEFHYSELEQDDFHDSLIEPVFRVKKHLAVESRPEGYRYKNCLASYLHLHFGSNPEFAAEMVEAARRGFSSSIL
jgi:cobyrinic acid a,c-diamide synthase